MSLLLVGVGIAVAMTFLVGSPVRDASATAEGRNPAPSAAQGQTQPENPVVSRKVERSLENRGTAGTGEKTAGAGRARRAVPAERGPEDKTLRVTIPGMSRIDDAAFPYAEGDDDAAFKKYAGVHLRGTGDPWDRGANVYLAGHRLGYPGTDSFLAFWDLNNLENGDRIFLTDADGKRYVYKVFRDFVVDPSEVSVTLPVEGRNILTLQTCTLPDYSRRLIVQAERVV